LIDSDLTINVYPTPTTEQIHVEVQNESSATVYLFSLDGQLLQQKAFNAQTKLQLESYSSGTYLLMIEQSGKKSYRQIQKID